MAKIVEIIREHHDDIIRMWREEAYLAASARGLTTPEFENLMPVLLSALGSAEDDLGLFTGRRSELLDKHLSSRLRQGFDLAEIIEEISILGRTVCRVSDARAVERPDAQDIQRFFAELNAAATTVADMFRKHMAEDEQTEKRYARLLQQIASEALAKDAPPFKQRLKEVVALIKDAMSAQAATLLLFEPDGQTLFAVASAGVADAVLESFVQTPDPCSFARQVANHREPTPLLDAVTVQLPVDDLLKRNGIQSLLGVRLPPRHRLTGILYVGLSAMRRFSAREFRRIESLTASLTLHLDNARLFADLQEKIAALTAERELRERFMAILAHDLRGPLSVAKMGAVMLMHHPEKLDERRDLAAKIDGNIDRSEKMIRDLLDTSRIRANERLPLRLDECDLAGLARTVLAELDTIYGAARFILKEDRVHGIWDADELRRALWNLAINAVKYGDPDQPITIEVKQAEPGAQISVHNYGSVITPEDQAVLFNPFARTQQAMMTGKAGWGLGLTLVRGCAEAHGGKVTIESGEIVGTTFTIHLPLDSRPYQVESNLAA